MLKSEALEKPSVYLSRLVDYGQLLKLRLSTLVVLSAALTFILGSSPSVNWVKLVWLVIGGFLITGSSNAINQILEKETDKLMDRTRLRPLPDGRISVHEAIAVAVITGLSGLFILGNYINEKSFVLGITALISYAFIYTPLKKVTPFAVFVGAFPGAIPTMLGWVAATNTIDYNAWILFSIQFMWQFPHFWSIAWRLDDDYKKAGFQMLPSPEGRSKSSAYQTMIYTFTLIPIGFLPYLFHISGWISAIVIGMSGIYFFYQSIQLLRTCSMEAASRLMFGSFLYLPVVLISLVIDKI